MSKKIKKGDLVRVTDKDGNIQILRVNKVTKKGILGDSYNFEKKYKRGDACSYKIADKNISIEKEDAIKIEGQLMQSNLRVKVENDQVEKAEDADEEKIDTSRRGRKRGKRNTKNKSESPALEAKQIKAPDGRRVIAKRRADGKKIEASMKTKAQLKLEEKDPKDLTEEERQKLERIRIREEKKKERERKKRLKQIEPNEDVEVIEVNPFLEDEESKQVKEFPLEGCSKFSDNRKFLYLYQQGKTHKKARKELEQLILKDSSLSNPFQPYSAQMEKDIFDFAVEDEDIDLIKILLKEYKVINSGKSKRPTLPTSSLNSVGTGQFNRYQFGFKTRAVSLGRGGKEGNNAFTHDNSLIGSMPNFYDAK